MRRSDPKSPAQPGASAAVADIPWHVATHAVELARALFGAQAVALFQLVAGSPRLLASHGVAQVTLDVLAAKWPRTRSIPGLRPWPSGSDEQPGMMLSCANDGIVVGLVYLEGRMVCHPACVPSLLPFSRVMACLLRGVVSPDEEAMMDGARANADIEGARLYMLMETHEWNLSRVARELGLSRMTVYNRLRREGLTRKRVSKARGPRADIVPTAGSGPSGEVPAVPADETQRATRRER